MKILKFISSLLPSLEKNKVVEDLRISISELENTVIPTFKVASAYFKTEKLKDEASKELSTDFYKKATIHGAKQANFLGDVEKLLINLKDNANVILEQAETVFENHIVSDGLTAKKVALIKASESISFVAKFSLDMLNYIYVKETTYLDQGLNDELALAPVVNKYVESKAGAYFMSLSDYGIPIDKFKQKMDSIPDVVVNSKTAQSVAGIYDEADIDPFTSAMMSNFTGSPIYHIRLVIAEWQASRYKANKEKKKVLELRLLYLKQTQDKKPDAKVQQEINYIQGRIDKIEMSLKDAENNLN